MSFSYGKPVLIRGICHVCKQPFERKSHSGNAKRIRNCGSDECVKAAKRAASKKCGERRKLKRND